ncbi:MAG: hypothetical protein IJ529_03030 [Alphaproteobacteria bacterium]|nr:hypothetical protein [Alphaproteobacteria bacterium]
MFYKIKEFIKEIGKYSFEAMQQKHQIDFKEDNQAMLSIVTDVDLHNSQAFKEFAEKNFSDLNYMIIDEESIDNLGEDLFKKIESTEYQFVFDPIDGTLNYSSGLPFYGILLAVFKKGKPLYGFICAPALDELVYTDGKQVFREHLGKTAVLNEFPKNISRVVQAHVWEVKLKPNHIKGKFIVQDYFSAAIYSLYLSLGQLRAVLATAKLWDIAPLMIICKIYGMGIYDYDTNEEITISPKHISNKGKIKNMMIMGFKDDISEVKDIFSEIVKVD